jgi:hypothetical protein
VEADAAVDPVMRGLRRRNVPVDASLRGTDNFIARIGSEASCRGGTTEDVEADAAVNWVMRCLTSRCGLPEDPSPRGAGDGASGRVSYSTISHIPSLLENKLTFRIHGGASASSPTLVFDLLAFLAVFRGVLQISAKFPRKIPQIGNDTHYIMRTCKWTCYLPSTKRRAGVPDVLKNATRLALHGFRSRW